MTRSQEIRIFEAALTAANSRGDSKVHWGASPFGRIKELTNVRKSAAGCWILHELARRELGLHPTAPSRPPASRQFGETIVKIKTSVQWSNGMFVYEQIRLDEPYDCMALVGVKPSGLMLWVVPRTTIVSRSARQHAEESRWLKFEPEAPPKWLAVFGGSVQRGLHSLNRIVTQ